MRMMKDPSCREAGHPPKREKAVPRISNQPPAPSPNPPPSSSAGLGGAVGAAEGIPKMAEARDGPREGLPRAALHHRAPVPRLCLDRLDRLDWSAFGGGRWGLGRKPKRKRPGSGFISLGAQEASTNVVSWGCMRACVCVCVCCVNGGGGWGGKFLEDTKRQAGRNSIVWYNPLYPRLVPPPGELANGL